MSLIVQQVTKYYERQKALDDVSFHIRKGEVVALLGPNGAGKSTMLKIISCYLRPTAGKILVCGFDTAIHPLAVKKCVGYLPENNPLYYDMYVKEYLHFVAGVFRLGKTGRKRVDEIIEMTGLTEEYRKTIGALSKGYRQRVGLAQALIHDPEVLILDEPTSGLDPNQLADIRALIRKIGKEKTVILSTHIMQEVEAVCNRAIIINKGKIMADAATSELPLMNRTGSVLSVEFDQPVEPEDLKNIKGVMDLLQENPNTFKIYSGNHEDIRAEVFEFAKSNGLVLLTLSLKKQSLEDVFRDMTL